jgi:DNA repair exonuclease SbcCD ATPase subunit
MSQRVGSESVTVSVRNIGGIDSCEIVFDSSVTVFEGKNATNRTSLLTAVSSVLGGSAATLKSDAEEGYIELALGGETYTCHYERSDGGVTVETNPYTEETETVDSFACLLEDNSARRAVERGDDLRGVIMRPIDMDAIQRRVRSIREEREEVASRLNEIEREGERLPSLEERRSTILDRGADVKDELATVQATVEDQEADIEKAEAAEGLVERLEELRRDRTETRERIEDQQAALSALRDERDQVESELDDLTPPDDELTSLGTDLDRLQERERTLAGTIDDLATVVEFNEELLDSGEPGVLTGETARDPAAGLDPASETIDCWTCGSRVRRGEITDKLQNIRDLLAEKREERRELGERLDDLRERRDELRTTEERRESLGDRRSEIDEEIERREQRIEALEDRLASSDDDLTELEERTEETELFQDSELPEQYQRLSELEYERGQVEQELAEIGAEIERIEGLADERAQLERQGGELRDELGSLRTRIEDIERTAVETFNEHMAEILSLLAYENIERVWIERKHTDRGSDRSETAASTFDLHVVRATAEESVYEDTVENLSESEREVIGLITALAGYLAHDVYETVPMILLDSLEAIDADRIAALVEYFVEYAPYLLVSLLPEDAAALDDDYAYITADELRP